MSSKLLQAGRDYLAYCAGNSIVAEFTEFVFAHIPDLDVDAEIDDEEGLPASALIKHRAPVTRLGYINPSQVVASVLLPTAGVGDWQYNWIGIVNGDDELCAVMYQETAWKWKKDEATGQIGNALLRSFVVNYGNAQTIMNVTVPAAAWQFDFMARLNSSDSMRRETIAAIVGASPYFFNDAWQVEKVGATFVARAGNAIVGGLPLGLSADVDLTSTGIAAEKRVWLDVAEVGDISETVAAYTVTCTNLTTTLTDYVDANGVQHYVTLIAQVSVGGAVTDKRADSGFVLEYDNIFEGIWGHILDDQNPHGVTKAQVGLGNLPNAKSDATNLDSSDSLATSKAVNDLRLAMPIQKTYSRTLIHGASQWPSGAHGLGGVPCGMQIWGEVLAAQNGWAVGDRFPLPLFEPVAGTGGNKRGHLVYATASHIGMKSPSDAGMYIPDAVTGEQVVVSKMSLKVTVEAWR